LDPGWLCIPGGGIVDLIKSVETPVEILIDFGNVTFVALLGLCGVVGLLALASPRALAVVAS
jgi:hypothetical protein